jgi:outer membrane protein assembly factor BamB/tetratricopeptide (TPR) repeat protein
MSTYTLFCPDCDAFLIDLPAGNALDVCPACGWQRPCGTGGVGTPLGDPIALPASPPCDVRGLVAGGGLWLAARTDDAGYLLRVAQDGNVQPVALDAGACAAGLCSDGQRVFVALAPLDMPSGAQPVVALDAATGDEVWRHVTHSAALSPPVCRGQVVACTGDGMAYALDAAGRSVWSVPAPVTPGLAPVAAGEVLVSAGPLQAGRPLRALALADGGVRWEFLGEGGFARAPAADETTVYASSAGSRLTGREPAPGGLYALDAATGMERWPAPYVPPRRCGQGWFTAAPVVAGDRVLAGCGDYFEHEKGYALHAVRCADAHLDWRVQLRKHLRVRPAAHGDLVVCVDDSGLALGLDLADGNERWRAELGGAPASVPAFWGDAVWIADGQSRLHRLRWRPAQAAPDEPAAAYAARGQHALEAAAHALAGNLVAAGHALLAADDAAHGLRIFELAGDLDGRLAALARLGRWPEVITLAQPPEAGDLTPAQRRRLAEAHAALGDHRAAADQLAGLGAWAEAVAAYERAGTIEDLMIAAGICRDKLHDPAAERRLRLAAAEMHAAEQRWESAWKLFRLADDLERAAEFFKQAIALCERERLDDQAARLLEERARLEMELAGRRALGDVEIASWLERAAHHYMADSRPADATRCREQAAHLMATPRFHIQLSAPAEPPFVEGKQKIICVRLTNRGYGPAQSVKVRVAGDIERPAEREFADVAVDDAVEWDTIGVVPVRHGELCLRVEVEYTSYRDSQPGRASFEQTISVAERGLISELGRALKGGAPVQLNVDKILSPGAVSNELNVTDSVFRARGGVHMGGAAPGGSEPGAEPPSPVIDAPGGDVVDVDLGLPAVGVPEPRCMACGAARTAGGECTNPDCDTRRPGHCRACGRALVAGAPFCGGCGMQVEGQG